MTDAASFEPIRHPFRRDVMGDLDTSADRDAAFPHESVMLAEVTDVLADVPAGYV